MSIRSSFSVFIEQLQDEICDRLAALDGKAGFEEDAWQRPGGGGGRTRTISEGRIFEKGGVNISKVHGELPEAMQKYFGVSDSSFFACGLSLVLHPQSPMIPTVHANYRYFELYDDQGEIKQQWFGGGADLTPYYVWEEDAVHFHKVHRERAGQHGEDLYPPFKEACDAYFFNHHRDEARGIGGMFFDYLKPGHMGRSIEQWQAFVQDMGKTFLLAYLPIAEKRLDEAYGERERYWQEVRRGRYVEFNLIHDKGTQFGLKTKGRIESIFMSLPPRVRWVYDFHPEPGSREADLLSALTPRNWADSPAFAHSS
ncbi:MAG: oxygen-dependent coproporphyrinogen oxidase [Bacteroidota bacterium]